MCFIICFKHVLGCGDVDYNHFDGLSVVSRHYFGQTVSYKDSKQLHFVM